MLRKRYQADRDARAQEKALTQQAKLVSQTHTEFPFPNVSSTNQVSLTPQTYYNYNNSNNIN